MACLFLFVFAFAFRDAAVIGAPLSADVTFLLSFKGSVASDPTDILSDWILAGKNHCEWYGVTCDRFSGRVTALNISGSKIFTSPEFPTQPPEPVSKIAVSSLAGTLSPSVGNLTDLRILSIPYNAFYGEIPAQIGHLQHLEILELQGNNFSGRIPHQISDLFFLRVLNLAYNSFSGQIPDILVGLSRVEIIDLSNNQLSSRIKMNSYGRCESLTHLRLSGNFLVDKIPPEIGNCTNLQSLLLNGNILEGRIPAEIGDISELRILDVSLNSLTDRIPKELANCGKLVVLILTNLVNLPSAKFGSITSRVEFNAFMGGIPWEVFSIPSLQILWAPRANLNGRLPHYWGDSCKLQVLNLAQNYRITGVIPERLGKCRNLSFLDLSSNSLEGSVPLQLGVKCMIYLNVSRNSLYGSLPDFAKSACNQTGDLFKQDVLKNQYLINLFFNFLTTNPFGSAAFDEEFAVLHDFSWNGFVSPIPSFSFGDGFFSTDWKLSYGLLLNNNQFNGSLPSKLFLDCQLVQSFAVNLSVNQISGGISSSSLSCLKLKEFEAAYNQLTGPIPPAIGDLQMLNHLDLRGNKLNGTLPDWLWKSKNLKWVLLGRNNFTGKIPSHFGQLTSLTVLDLSRNDLMGSIPPNLASAPRLETVLLDHNMLSGQIPPSFSNLTSLTVLDVSFNNLSGSVPHLQNLESCDYFQGNALLQPCPYPNSAPPAGLPVPLEVKRWVGRSSKLKPFGIAMVAAASFIVFILVVLVLFLAFGKRKIGRVGSLKKKVFVTFINAPAELNYENVVRATGNFSVRNLIGTGGFGATYKAELFPGFLVAVKRLSIGKFQGLQQFDAEIRTLGRIRHKNLVTLIGYHMGEADTFLVYNYLSGGNLETFIHNRSSRNVWWPTLHKIALDIAYALAYLHDSCVPRIVHRDIKPSNILLDEKLNAYLSDFGLARLLEVSETHATTDVEGTFGYLAPEYATTCRVSDKSDVYSFGVVLLELMSGKKSLDPSFSDYGNGFNIAAWGKLLIREGRFSEIFSPELWEAGPRDHLIGMLRLALNCTVETLSIRPTMKHVVGRLKQLDNT